MTTESWLLLSLFSLHSLLPFLSREKPEIRRQCRGSIAAVAASRGPVEARRVRKRTVSIELFSESMTTTEKNGRKNSLLTSFFVSFFPSLATLGFNPMSALLKSSVWGTRMTIAAPSRSPAVSTSGTRSVVTMAKKKGELKTVVIIAVVVVVVRRRRVFAQAPALLAPLLFLIFLRPARERLKGRRDRAEGLEE